MPDVDARKHWRVFLAITQGKDFNTIARRHHVTREEYDECVRFVRYCRRIDRNAWTRWILDDDFFLAKTFRKEGEEPGFVHTVSLILGRSENAVLMRIRKLGLVSPDRPRRAA
jgi:hypothetical protein